MAVSTINKSGEDYNTLTLWEADKNGDLVGDTRQETAECYDDDGDLVDELTVNGSTTDATYYMEVTVPVADRHDGTDGTGFCIDGSTYCFMIRDDYFRVSWVEAKGASSETFYVEGVGTLIHHVLAYDTDKGVSWHSGDFTIHNSIFWDLTDDAVWGNSGDTDGCVAYNVTAVRALTDGDAATAGFRYVKAINCAAFHWGGSSGFTDFLNLGTGSDYNISHDDSADDVGSNCLINKAAADQFENISAGSEDLHLKSGADCIDAGTNLGSPYDYDIDNVLRTGTWDIGADELVAAGGIAVPILSGGEVHSAIFGGQVVTG